MPSLYSRLGRLRRLPSRVRVQALAQTLPWARGEESDAFVAEALELAVDPQCRRVLSDVLACWSHLSIEARRAAIAYAGPQLTDMLTTLAPRCPRETSAVLLEVIEDPHRHHALDFAGVAAIARDLALGAEHAGATSARRVLAALISIVELGAPGWGTLDAALAEQAERFPDHRDQALLDAIAKTAHRAGPAVRAWMSREGEAGHMALRSSARRSGAGQSADATTILGWLGAPALAGTALDPLRAMARDGRLSEVIERSHLLMLRGRSVVLRRRVTGDALTPTAAQLASMPETARRGAVRWIAAQPISNEQRLGMYSAMLTDPDAGVRLRAVRAIADMTPSRAGDEALLEFAFDADARVASAAAGALSAARSPSRRAGLAANMALLARSPHAKVRALARVASPVFATFGTDAGVDTRWRCPIAARSAMSTDRAGFIAALRTRMMHHDRAKKVEAMELVRRLELVSEFQNELDVLRNDLDPGVASRASKLMQPLMNEAEALSVRTRHINIGNAPAHAEVGA